MPRYIGRPVGVEAHQWTGHAHMLPDAFRLAIRAHRAGGIVEVMTGDGIRQCKHEDWIVAGPDGTFSVQRNAMFETWFEEHRDEPPPPTSTPMKRTKEKVHG